MTLLCRKKTRKRKRNKTRVRNIWRATMLLLITALILALCFVNTERAFVAPCTVILVNKAGKPVQGARISESWNAYSYDLSGGLDLVTNENGEVMFPPQKF